MATRTITTKLAVDGEKEFKSQMSSVNNELRTLKSEMKLADAEFKGQANTLEALTEKDRILRDEYAQQAEKVKALEQAVADASRAYGDADEKTDKYRQQLNNAKADLINLDREIGQNEQYMAEAAKSSDGCAKSIDGFGKEVREAGDKTSIFGEVLKANLTSEAIINGVRSLGQTLKELPVEVVRSLANAVKDLGEEVINSTLDAAAYADEILTLSTNTGISTDALQEYQYMAELTDTSLDTITGSMSKLIKNMSTASKGSGDAAAAFNALGVEVTNADGTLRNNQDVFYEVIDALGQMDNETQRDALSMAIFGKSAQDLNTFIAQGSEGIAAFAQEAHDMGAVLDEDTLQVLGAVDDAYQRFQQTLDAAKNKLGADFAPGIELILNGLTALLSGNVDEGIDLIMQGIDNIDAMLDNFGPAALAALDRFLDTIADRFPEIAESGVELLLHLIVGIAKAFPKLIPAAAEAVQTIVDALWDNRGLIAEAGMDLIRGLWEGIKSMGAWLGNKIKGFGSEIVQGFKNAFNIHSPSGVMRDEVGKFLAEGVGLGFENEMDAVSRQMENALMDGIPSNGELSAMLDVGTHYTARPAAVSVDEQSLHHALAAAGASGNELPPITIIVQSMLDGKKIGETVTTYQENRKRSRGK